ncbi:hypothetical protein C8R43DRAFT_1189678 [Mycena crocata]|nr:hypothetical protein C8R43DRAFT_1189678 [Mycena crocata]
MAHDLVIRDTVTGERETAMRYVFYGLQLAGLLGAVVLLLTAIIWRKAARRHASWFNFMITWIISCSSYILLIGVPRGGQPNGVLCLLQASLVYSVPSLVAGSTIALVIHVYMTLRNLLYSISHRAAWTIVLVIGPYIPAWAMFFHTLNVGLKDMSLVQSPSDGTYCGFNTTVPQKVSAIVVAVIMILCLGVEVIILQNLRRAWNTLKRDNRASISMIVRVLAFTLVGMLSIILSFIFLALPDEYNHGSAFNIVIATIPVSSVLVFGTQKVKILRSSNTPSLTLINCRIY